ncbi:hypothetical protein ABIF86_008282 [Bradyrhizobium japonicum]
MTFTLNFAPIDLEGNTEIIVGRQTYSAERLRELRSEFYETHVFQRMGSEDAIVDIPIAGDVKPVGSVTERIDLKKWQGPWSALVTAALLRAFHGQREIQSTWPLVVLGSSSRGLLKHSRIPIWLEKRTALEFDTRSIYLPSGKRVIGLVCETRTKNIIGTTCDELIKRGVPVLGRYVQIEVTQNDKRLLPRRKLAGRVRALEGNLLILDDHAEGLSEITTKEAYLEPRREVFDDAVKRIAGSEADSILAGVERQLCRR